MATSDRDWLFLVPGDPGQRTGGYGYVREVVAGLQRMGEEVILQGLPGQFPKVDQEARQALEMALQGTPQGTTVVVDGLALCGCPEVAERHGRRIDLIALVHHPLADETGLTEEDRQHFLATERRTLAAVRQVVTTSASTAESLARFQVPPARIAVVTPGVHPVELPEQGVASEEGVHIFCLAHLSPRKAQLDLVEALGRVTATGWSCDLAGAVDRDQAYARKVIGRIKALGLKQHIRMPGELSGPALEQAFSRADLFVLPSVHEGYGMVIDEALAHGLPVISSDGGALASTADRPGCATYPAGEVDALVRLLDSYLQDRQRLHRQRMRARVSATGLRTWDQCAAAFRRAVPGDRKQLPPGAGFDARWLALREPADHSARARSLTARTTEWLAQRPPGQRVLADIGAGSGSNWRYLCQALPEQLASQCTWHLYDQDQDLLDGVAAHSGVQVHAQRLEAADLDQQLPPQLDLLTASALIDLMSEPWLQAFAEAAAARRAAVLVVLSYAGSFRLTPSHKSDHDLKVLVNQHQHGDKGTGAACGPEATGILRQALEAANYTVCLEPSTWHLGADHSELMIALIEGWADAARAQLRQSGHDSPPAWLEDWLSARIAQARQGQLSIEVEHADLFGAPAA